ncbi:ABC transporter substrate-binding protein [Cuspidothrix issatschenkoi LEGE 03284]|uniref:ABC transporter substrate-binding protein n=1 Tax=Cuspidothrix issatschenkoi TaxID=230752 RepID=UPI00187F9902|nr:ABC transporter substrate-binding protein [Cuspidothrix issatschenkoi]MBE9231072.1 ABC transporter substrate-binding protein [Cuspidothrix issatschenkoi LEGE 03284]
MITFPKHQRNPYIVGRPIDQQLLFGRGDVFSSISTHLQQQQQIIVCYGQRRIGKSSVLRNIPRKLQDLNEFVFVRFSLDYYSQKPLSKILADLAQQVVSDLCLDKENIKLPVITDLESDSQVFLNEFLPQVYQLIENKNIVFLLDEFDVLLNNDHPELLRHFNKSLTKIISTNNKLFFILFIEQKSINNPKTKQIFKDVPAIEIGLLDENSTKDLIIKPAENILEYEEDAIKEIFNLSAGHPYLIQAICFSIFGRARENDNWTVNREDVESIINKVVELAGAGLAWFWDGFSIAEKIVFSAIAESQETSENYLALIARLTNELDNKLIIETGEKIKVELVRRWIIQHHPLKEEIYFELDKLNLDQKKNQSSLELYLTAVSDKNNVSFFEDANQVKYEIIKSPTKLSKNTSLNINILSNRQKAFPVVTPLNPKLIILPTIATTLSLIISSILLVNSTVKSTNPCPEGEKLDFGVFCVADSRISRGERTLFPANTNTFRDQGIQAFQRENYQEAADLFKKAIGANRNDPEVVIYYNNALARKSGSPLTLAVVVRSAEGVLRGVAQAQDQFNRNNGLTGRLLEIVIANDNDDPIQSQQIAQQLINDTSILGVIGHNSSDATRAALPEYEKAGLAVIAPTSTSIFLLQNPVFFRVVYSDKAAGKALAEYAFNKLKVERVVVFINRQSIYSDSIREVFTRHFENLGGKVVRKIDITASSFDAKKEVAESVDINKAQAAILLPNTQITDIAIEIAKEITNKNEQLKTQKVETPELKMLGGDSLYKRTTLERGGKNVEGLIISVPWFEEQPEAKTFAKRARNQWGVDIGWTNATSYDATQAFIKSLSASSTRTTVLDRLKNVNLLARETSGYPLRFTEERERQGQAVLVEIKNGKFTIIRNK